MALECKQLSSNIRNYDKRQWEKVAKEQCKPGIKCKFVQNPGLSDILLKCTENKHIVKSTTDRFWGTSIPLVSDNCLDNRKWISPGLLGEILEEICSELASTDSPTNDQNPPPTPLPFTPAAVIIRAWILQVLIQRITKQKQIRSNRHNYYLD